MRHENFLYQPDVTCRIWGRQERASPAIPAADTVLHKLERRVISFHLWLSYEASLIQQTLRLEGR